MREIPHVRFGGERVQKPPYPIGRSRAPEGVSLIAPISRLVSPCSRD